jgi:hypothetical protein
MLVRRDVVISVRERTRIRKKSKGQGATIKPYPQQNTERLIRIGFGDDDAFFFSNFGDLNRQ